MGATEVTQFLTHLAVAAGVAPSPQNQAKAALLFLYKEVLDTELPWPGGIVIAKSLHRLPVVLTQDEVQRLLNSTGGTNGLILRLLYGTGLRIMECLRLRVKDVKSARDEASNARHPHQQAGDATYAPALLCHALAASGIRYP